MIASGNAIYGSGQCRAGFPPHESVRRTRTYYHPRNEVYAISLSRNCLSFQKFILPRFFYVHRFKRPKKNNHHLRVN